MNADRTRITVNCYYTINIYVFKDRHARKRRVYFFKINNKDNKKTFCVFIVKDTIKAYFY